MRDSTVLLEVGVVLAELGLPTHLPAVLVADGTVRAVRAREVATQFSLVPGPRVGREGVGEDLDVRG